MPPSLNKAAAGKAIVKANKAVATVKIDAVIAAAAKAKANPARANKAAAAKAIVKANKAVATVKTDAAKAV